MNSESFAEYLAQPAKLYQLPYQEIKNLVAEYPYSSNLRLMLLIKSKIEHDPKFERYLHQLAAHTFDRSHLYELNHHELKEMLDLASGTEERLELHDLSAMSEKEILTVDLGQETAEQYQEASIPYTASVPQASKAHIEEEEEEDLNIELSPIAAPSVPTAVEKPEQEKVAVAVAPYVASDALLADIATLPLILPAKTSTTVGERLIAWQQYLNDQQQRRLQLLKENALSGQALFEKKAAQIAAQSVANTASVATETLAKLLERQGNFEKAIKMYEQLSLLYPEKNRYFAATIEKLKKNI